MPHYADGTEVRVGDTATLADGVPDSVYMGDLKAGEGLVVKTITPGADMCNGAIVLERALDGRPAVLGVISSLTLTAKGLRLVRRAS